jgi:hypothetical protein
MLIEQEMAGYNNQVGIIRRQIMQAFVYEKYGLPHHLELSDVEKPTPKA